MKFGIYILCIETPVKSFFETGWGNGYVLLPNIHNWFGIDYNDVPVFIHGGLTFSEKFESVRFPEWIKDKEIFGDITLDNYKDFNDYWIIGFDTSHFGDNKINCSKEFVINETNYLLEQCLV